MPGEDEKEFQNVGKYKYFNTNNLWVNLEALKATIDKNEGVRRPGHQEWQDGRPARQEVDEGAAARDGDGCGDRVV